MRHAFAICAGLPLLLALSACNTTEDPALEGMVLAGGDAIAHNSALQIIDPWPAGVQDTELRVPAARGGAADDAPAQAPPAVVPAPIIDD
ncbi:MULTISPECIES: hypothetical protein [unclassified Roseitalea]|uniref:hypothetical protein n=1 Tax=unclassified Roseitalea TaxID=2639107 RepID=UPI00273E25AF|nr:MULTISPECIES: hypothetical protein [unclassified Roseitalea]